MCVVIVCMANIIRRLYSLSTLSLRRYRDFSRSLLRRLIPTAARPRVFCVMRPLCSGYALVISRGQCCGAEPHTGLSNVVPVAGGGTPPLDQLTLKSHVYCENVKCDT